MKAKRENLEKELNSFLSQYNASRKIKNAITDKFSSHGLLPGDVKDIFSQRRPIETLSMPLLCLLTIYLHDADIEDAHLIDPVKFFTDFEIEEAKKFKVGKEESNKFPIVFENVIKINDEQWATSLNAKQLNQLFENGSVIYNPETQRNLKVKEFRDKIVTEININKSSVQEIKTRILENRFISNFITLNIEQDGNENFAFDNGKLVINSGTVAILDGWHRSLAMIYALQENNEVQYNTGVMITWLSVDKAKALIIQEDKRNPISKKYVKSLDSDNMSNLVVKKLNENSSSYLRGKITTDATYIKNNKAVVMFDVLSDAIEMTFAPKDNMDLVKYSKWLMDGFNYVIETNPNMLNNTNEVFWVACVIILHELYEKENWQNALSSLINVGKDVFDEVKYASINKAGLKRINEVLNEKGVLGNV